MKSAPPLRLSLVFSELLIGSVSTPEQHDAAITIQRNGDHLLSIISDILDLSKIEAGRMQLENIPCSPTKLLDDIVRLMKVRVDGKGLPFEVKKNGSIPETVICDPVRIRQILINLVGNAIKFTESGHIEIGMRFDELTSDESAMLIFDVMDTGIGISSEQIHEIFQPFAQAEASTSRVFGGSGLGLAISQRLANMLGGDIEVDSQLGKGSRFTLSIPVECPNQSPKRD